MHYHAITEPGQQGEPGEQEGPVSPGVGRHCQGGLHWVPQHHRCHCRRQSILQRANPVEVPLRLVGRHMPKVFNNQRDSVGKLRGRYRGEERDWLKLVEITRLMSSFKDVLGEREHLIARVVDQVQGKPRKKPAWNQNLWGQLWDGKALREHGRLRWAAIFDPGTHMVPKRERTGRPVRVAGNRGLRERQKWESTGPSQLEIGSDRALIPTWLRWLSSHLSKAFPTELHMHKPVLFLHNGQAENACQSSGWREDLIKQGGELIAAHTELCRNMVVKSRVLGCFSGDALRSAKARVLVVPHDWFQS